MGTGGAPTDMAGCSPCRERDKVKARIVRGPSSLHYIVRLVDPSQAGRSEYKASAEELNALLTSKSQAQVIEAVESMLPQGCHRLPGRQDPAS